MASGRCVLITRILTKPVPEMSTPYPILTDLSTAQPVTRSSAFLMHTPVIIPMAASDMNKIAFITDDTNYFYKVMPFGLKNARATYQRLMDKVFSHLMAKCVEVYVDDMVVKSPSHHQHAQDLSESFPHYDTTTSASTPISAYSAWTVVNFLDSCSPSPV